MIFVSKHLTLLCWVYIDYGEEYSNVKTSSHILNVSEKHEMQTI